MDEIKFYQEKLKGLLSEKRYRHSVNVMETAVKMAEKYGTDIKKSAVAGILHDCAKEMELEQMLELCREEGTEPDEMKSISRTLMHPMAGAAYARLCLGIKDQEVLDAIGNHTTGRPGMSLLEEIIFLADFIEPGREGEYAEKVRKLACTDIKKAMLATLNSTIIFIIEKNKRIHLDTIITRNYYLKLN